MTNLTSTAPIVRETKIISTMITVYSAWELMGPTLGLGSTHSTIGSADDGQWIGRIGTRRLPAELEALPAYSVERSVAVNAWHEAQYAEAYATILAQHPDAASGRRSMGEIEVYA